MPDQRIRIRPKFGDKFIDNNFSCVMERPLNPFTGKTVKWNNEGWYFKRELIIDMLGHNSNDYVLIGALSVST